MSGTARRYPGRVARPSSRGSNPKTDVAYQELVDVRHEAARRDRTQPTKQRENSQHPGLRESVQNLARMAFSGKNTTAQRARQTHTEDDAGQLEAKREAVVIPGSVGEKQQDPRQRSERQPGPAYPHEGVQGSSWNAAGDPAENAQVDHGKHSYEKRQTNRVHDQQ